MAARKETEDRGIEGRRDANLQSRRDLLKGAGGIAAYVAPTMAVLLKGDPVNAWHAPWHVRFCMRFPNHWSCQISP